MAVNNSFAYIEKTLPGVVDKVFALNSLTDSLIGGSEIKLDFLDARTVKIFMLASTGLYDYNRGGHGRANTRGAARSTTETFTLSQERYSEIPLDKLDTLDDGETVLGHLATEFIRTKVVPEFDTYRFSKLASYTSATMGNRVVEAGAIAANTIISKFNAAFKWMAEQKVPETDQVIYVSPTVMELIRNTTELAKRLHQSDMSKNVQFAIEMYENRQIVVVPSDMFYTDAQTGNGIYPASSSKVINFMIVDRKAPIIVKKLDYAKVFNSVDQNGSYLGYVGYLLTNLYYHDLFVPENKRVAIYCNVSNVAASTMSSALLVDAVAGSASGKTIIKSVLTQPAGILYDALGLYTTNGTAPAIGSSFTVTPGSNDVVLGAEFTPDASHNIIVAVLDGKVVATSRDFTNTLPVGA
jgi:hypothetical protein